MKKDPSDYRILLVDNDKGFQQSLLGLLRKFNYSIFPLDHLQGVSAVDYHNQKFDLALVDRRVCKDTDEDDTTGQDFAVELCNHGTPTALVTAHLPEDLTLFDLLRSGGVTAVVEKKFVAELPYCIEEFWVSRRFPNCVAEFRWKGRE